MGKYKEKTPKTIDKTWENVIIQIGEYEKDKLAHKKCANRSFMQYYKN